MEDNIIGEYAILMMKNIMIFQCLIILLLLFLYLICKKILKFITNIIDKKLKRKSKKIKLINIKNIIILIF
jgi:hypothetical protein